MIHHRLKSLLVFTIAILAPLVHALADAKPQTPLPTDPDALTALLIGEDLQRTLSMHVVNETNATRAWHALVVKGEAAVPALDRALASQDPLLRGNVVLILHHIKSPSTLPVLIRASEDPVPQVRARAVADLPVFLERSAYNAAKKALADTEVDVRRAALEAFSRPADMAPQEDRARIAVEVIKLLKSTETRKNAARALGELRYYQSVQPLTDVVGDPDTMTRYTVLEALGKIHERTAVPAIIPFLKDPEHLVRFSACRALGILGDMRATLPIIQAMSTVTSDNLAMHGAVALGRIGDIRATPTLLALLDHPDYSTAQAAITALTQINDPQSLDGLTAFLLRDSNPKNENTRKLTATALGKLGDPRAIPALGKYLEKNPSNQEAARALAAIRHPYAVEELVRLASLGRYGHVSQALSEVTGVYPSYFDKPDNVSKWWDENRAFYFATPTASPQTQPAMQ